LLPTGQGHQPPFLLITFPFFLIHTLRELNLVQQASNPPPDLVTGSDQWLRLTKVVEVCLQWLDELTTRPTHCEQLGHGTNVEYVMQLMEALTPFEKTRKVRIHGTNILLHLCAGGQRGHVLSQVGANLIHTIGGNSPHSLEGGWRPGALDAHLVSTLDLLISLTDPRPYHRVANLDVCAILFFQTFPADTTACPSGPTTTAWDGFLPPPCHYFPVYHPRCTGLRCQTSPDWEALVSRRFNT